MRATNRGSERERDDFYATPAWCVRALLRSCNLPGGAWFEPAVGDGAIVRAVNETRDDVAWSINDIVDRMPEFLNAPLDHRIYYAQFGEAYTSKGLNLDEQDQVVITNPPYNQALEFVQGAMKDGKIVVMLLRLNWLAGQARNAFLREHTPSIYVLPKRPSFTGGKTDSCEYAWFVWGLEETPTVHVIDVENCR